MNGPVCECDYAGAGCQIHPTTNPDGWGPALDDDPDYSYTGMDGYDGPTHIKVNNTKYLKCERHNHWYDPAKYDQCWYCWQDTTKTAERTLNRLLERGMNRAKAQGN